MAQTLSSLQSACGVTGDSSRDSSGGEAGLGRGGVDGAWPCGAPSAEALNAPETFTSQDSGGPGSSGVLLFLKSRFFPKDDSTL